MDGGAQKLLESVTIRTLHANGFSRSSTQASLVITDLLSRYLTLLTSTCAKYAQHADRTRLTAGDAVSALDELGVSVEELHEFGTTEGLEFNRYAVYKSLRRVEDLKEFRAHLSNGLRADTDDVIPLQYAPLPPELEEDSEEDILEDSDENDASGEEDVEMDVDDPESSFDAAMKLNIPRFTTAPFPLSPVSNPASPSRKRQRTLDWDPPSHIPDFLPPFPATLEVPPSPTAHPPEHPSEPPPVPVESTKIDKPPSLTVQTQAIPSTSSAASDYQVQVPYSQSSFSAIPEWHLPTPPSSFSSSSSRPAPRWSTPQTDPSLLAAYHHILTHPPPPNATQMAANPLRHKVAMALLSLTQSSSRWEVPDTLYGNISPNLPRVAPVGPTYPVHVTEPTDPAKKDFKFPMTMPRTVAAQERLVHLVSQQGSRIPELARHVLPPAIMARTSRLSHPPPLSRSSKILTYGTGVPAPWNANAPTAANTTDGVPPTPKEPQVNGKDKDGPTPALPDAKLFATWDHEHKDFRVPIAPIKGRTRLGSVQMGGGGPSSGSGSADVDKKPSAGTISLGARGKSSARIG